MSYDDGILRITERSTAGRHTKRSGLVSSWHPKKYLAKITFQPEGHETGWLPVHAMAAGDGTGLITGLAVGDQVEVEYQEGDFETGAIISRIHSEVDAAPEVQSGEHLLQTSFSSSLKLANDGSVATTGGKLKADMTDTSHISVPTSKIIYLGGDGTTGTYDFVATASGPSINVKVRIG